MRQSDRTSRVRSKSYTSNDDEPFSPSIPSTTVCTLFSQTHWEGVWKIGTFCWHIFDLRTVTSKCLSVNRSGCLRFRVGYSSRTPVKVLPITRISNGLAVKVLCNALSRCWIRMIECIFPVWLYSVLDTVELFLFSACVDPLHVSLAYSLS